MGRTIESKGNFLGRVLTVEQIIDSKEVLQLEFEAPFEN
jgi:hypothetical protein